MASNPYNLPSLKDRLLETFNTYFKLGYTTFGGPNAHIAILFDDIVTKRKWISSEQFTELFAICQALPGPASTELAYSLALVRSGFLCSIFAFLLWSIPGAIVMTVSGALIGSVKGTIPEWATRLEQGLASAAIGLVALAAYRMSTALATDKLTRTLALIAGSVSVLYTAPWLLPVMMIIGGIISFIYDAYLNPLYLNLKEKKNNSKKLSSESKDLEKGGVASTTESSSNENQDDQNTTVVKSPSVNGSIKSRSSKPESVTREEPMEDLKVDTSRKAFSYSKKLGFFFFLVFLALLIPAIFVRAFVHLDDTPGENPDGSKKNPLTHASSPAVYGTIVSTFYFVGSIIFGGGPVIIPLLKTYTVDSGWMTDQQFLVGLAIIQSLPGPNFNFACFLGAVAMVNSGRNAIPGAILAYLAIFFPGLILKNAIIPFWQFVREHKSVKMVFRGVNACALGLVFSAVWLLWIQTNAMGGDSGYHAVIASAAFVASGYLDIPAPLVIILGGGMGAIEYAVSK